MADRQQQTKSVALTAAQLKAGGLVSEEGGKLVLNNKKVADLLQQKIKTPGGGNPRAITVTVGVDF
jgi:hypothetical protein